jgi:hypothetical protein
MDPLALLPFALAAAGGRLGAHPVTALIAAGVTLLQRSAPLVRALAGRRSAVLMPPCPAWLVALAASDGRGMVVLDDQETLTANWLDSLGIGAVFTLTTGGTALPPDTPHVLLDGVPGSARVVVGGQPATVDLGSHFALNLCGDLYSPGATEDCLLMARDGSRYSHADVLSAARDAMRAHPFTPVDRTFCTLPAMNLPALATGLMAPLLAGGMLYTPLSHPPDAAAMIPALDPTIIVATSTELAAWRARARQVPALDARLALAKRIITMD